MIHRYFYDKNPHWKAIREEENKAEEEDKITREVYEEALEEEPTNEKLALDFTPIDARHLSSLPLVRSRVVKLLKASKNYIHESNNLLITIVRNHCISPQLNLKKHRDSQTRRKLIGGSSRIGSKSSFNRESLRGLKCQVYGRRPALRWRNASGL